MKYPKYPCRSCVYSKECGDNMRTEYCAGRSTKRQIKDMEKAGYSLTILHTKPVELKDIGAKKFFCPGKEVTPINVYISYGYDGSQKEISCQDGLGLPYLVEDIHQQVYPVPRDIAIELLTSK